MIEIQNIVKHYGNKTALNNVSMTIPDDCIVGLVGQNGAGKSTLLKILTGILDADSGCCIYDGKPFSTCIMEDVGYLPEQRGLYNKINVQEQLEYFASLRGLSIKQSRSAIDFWLSKFDIDDWRKRKISELSKGMQQKVQLITCLMHSPKYVFMDEPFMKFFTPRGAKVITQVIFTEELKVMCCSILGRLFFPFASKGFAKDFLHDVILRQSLAPPFIICIY